MKKLLFIILLLCSVAHAATSITKNDITWTFDGDYTTGQFANGDYWVVGPVTITSIDPCSVTGARIKNGSMINPSPTSAQGYDNTMYNNTYSSALNVALDVNATNTLVVPAGSSLVSTISVEAAVALPQLQSAEILTVLASSPAAGSFRPPYCGSDKTIRFNKSDLNYTLLKTLTAVTSTPVLATVEATIQRPWLDHKGGAPGRYMHPVDNMPDYGREMATNVGIASLMLHLDYTNNEKENLLIYLVQLGIDNYGIVEDGGITHWAADGGHASGRKWPILFAGMVLDDPNMKAIGDKSGSYAYDGSYKAGDLPPDYIHFGEDDQTFYVSPDDVYTSPYQLTAYHLGSDTGTVNVTNGSAVVQGTGTNWLSVNPDYDTMFGIQDEEGEKIDGSAYTIASIDSDTQLTLTTAYTGTTKTGQAYKISDFVYYGHGNTANKREFDEYVTPDINLAEWGIRHATLPSYDGTNWDASYRECCTANSWAGFVLAARLMSAQTLWNHDPLFDYMDRYMQTELDNGNYHSFNRQQDRFTEYMWDAYVASTDAISLPPRPNPASFSSVPTAISSSSITMTANTATDPCSPVYYLFTETSGNPGATSSSWQESSTYTDSGLTALTEYSYKVQTKDTQGNTGTESSVYSATTQAIISADANMLNCYKFDDNASSSVVLDSVGDTNGVFYSGVSEANTADHNAIGIIDGALTFDNTDDYIDLGDWTTPNDFSISLWVYFTARDVGDVVFQRGNGDLAGYGLSLYGYRFRFQLDEWSDVNELANTSGIVENTWYHVVCVSDNNVPTLYVDSVDSSDTLSETTGYNGGTKLQIGRRSSGTTKYFGGKIDQFLYFDKVLTQADVNALYNGGSGIEITIAGADTTAPTPNPAEFSTLPYAENATSITMIASVASDPCTPVYYYFTCTAGGGNDSGWQESTSYTDSGLTPSTEYTYTVTCKDGLGNIGTASSSASATTESGSPTAPSGLTATAISSSQINLSWTDNSNDETGFKIQRSTNGVDFSLLTTTAVNATSYNNTGLSASTQYWYKVSATNTYGDSDYTSTADATTEADASPPAADSNVTSAFGTSVESTFGISNESVFGTNDNSVFGD